MEMLHGMLDDLEYQIMDGKKVPLTNNQYMVNRDALLAAIQSIRDNLPNAVTQANRIVEKEAQIMEEANNLYQNIIAEAEAKARARGLESKQQADELMMDAQHQADDLYEGAKRQADEIIESAQRKARELVAESAIMVEANQQANDLMTEARREAQRERMNALDHCDEMLRRAEDAAIASANELREARMNFEQER